MDNNSIFELQHWLIKKIADCEKKPAIVFKGRQYTYTDLFSVILSQKKFLEKNNIRSKEIVALISDYSLESIGLFLALVENKNIIVPIASRVKNEIELKLQEAFVEKKIVIEGGMTTVTELEYKSENHPLIKKLQHEQCSGLVLFSSGSTGKPKAMLHDLDNLLEAYKLKKQRDSSLLGFLMFDHIGGIHTMFSVLACGAKLVIPENRKVDYISQLISEHKVNLLPASPTFLNLLLISEAYKRFDFSSLEMITYGTEPMPEGLLKRLKSFFPAIKFLQTFGTSETGITRTVSRSSDSNFLKLDDPNVEYKIINGELWLKSKIQILGYLNHDMNNFTEDGWYKTGDLIEQADDGYLRIIGREIEVINVGGEKVLPIEVESILLEMPEISDCLVKGEKNMITGQIVSADVVLAENVDPKIIRNKIRMFCKTRIDNYKIPLRVNVINDVKFGSRFKKLRLEEAKTDG